MKYTYYCNKQEIDRYLLSLSGQNQTDDTSRKSPALETVDNSIEVNSKEINSINSEIVTEGDFAMYEPDVSNVELSKGLATVFATADNETNNYLVSLADPP